MIITLSISIYFYNKNLTRNFKIVAFGDSFTSGSYVEAKDNYPSILENILNKNPKIRFKVINMGIPGETSAGGLDRIDSILEQKSDLVLLELGGNDMEQNIDVNIAKNNLDTILKKFKDNNQKVIILGLDTVDYYGLEYKNNFDAAYLDLSKKYNVLLVPSFLSGVRKIEKYNTADGEHPNKAGYEKIVSENIMPVLEKYLSENI